MESRTDHVMTRFSSPGSPGPRESAENNRFLYTDIFMVHSRFIIYSIPTLYHSIRSNTLYPLYTTVLDQLLYTHSIPQYYIKYSIPTLYPLYTTL